LQWVLGDSPGIQRRDTGFGASDIYLRPTYSCHVLRGEFAAEIHPWHLLAIYGRCCDHGYEGKDILEKEDVSLPRGGM